MWNTLYNDYSLHECCPCSGNNYDILGCLIRYHGTPSANDKSTTGFSNWVFALMTELLGVLVLSGAPAISNFGSSTGEFAMQLLPQPELAPQKPRVTCDR
jgi:hypothetical protein